MIKSFLQKHKQTLVNHTKLLSVLAFIALFILAIGGFFGALVTVTLAKILVVCIIFGVYMVMYEFCFSAPDNSW